MTRKQNSASRYGVTDENTPELTAEMLARATTIPELLKKLGLPPLPPAGRPPSPNPKQAVNLRLDPAIVAHFKSGGPRWQTRINAVLKAHVEAEVAKAAPKPRARKRA